MIRCFHDGQYWTNPVFYAGGIQRKATKEEMDAMPWHLYTEAMRMKHRVIFYADFPIDNREYKREFYRFEEKLSLGSRFRPKLRMDRDDSAEKQIAFAMGMHSRLGKHSPHKNCSSDILRVINSFLN